MFKTTNSCSIDSHEWLFYFKKSARNHLDLTTPDSHVLSGVELKRISASIRDFQLGESSEGHCLMRMAIAFAEVEGDEAYIDTVKLLIAEENRHSGYLRSFMQEHGIARAKRTWSDDIFRRVRKLAGLELSIRVLVSAEMLALVYYTALADATGSRKLSGICRRMLGEEEQHIRFQMATISRFNESKPAFLAAASDALHGLMYVGASLAVWAGHRAVLRTKHASLGSFLQAAWTVFAEAMAARREGLGARPESSALPA